MEDDLYPSRIITVEGKSQMVELEKIITLFEQKSDCCGCGACMNICPKSAIRMVPDSYGFLYPVIDSSACVGCGVCKKICAYQQTEETQLAAQVYAAVNENERQLLGSASGGVFIALAVQVIESGGVVYGCSMEREGNKLIPRHIRVDQIDALKKLQGSKYVQSDSGKCFQEAKDDLRAEKTVLFSGTPCQVAALKRFLGKTDQRRLFTVDIICHGVPSAQLFQDYIESIEKIKGKKVIDFRFRDKSAGWGLTGSAVLADEQGNTRKIKIPVKLSSYYSLFLHSEIYRENCYQCKYAGAGRVGDLTIGDFWGIHQQHPDYLRENGGALDEGKGISCILVNTLQGNALMEEFGWNIRKMDSTFEKVANENGQLIAPSHRGKNRETVLRMYSQQGYQAVEHWFVRSLGIKKPVYEIWTRLPEGLKQILKRMKAVI